MKHNLLQINAADTVFPLDRFEFLITAAQFVWLVQTGNIHVNDFRAQLRKKYRSKLTSVVLSLETEVASVS